MEFKKRLKCHIGKFITFKKDWASKIFGENALLLLVDVRNTKVRHPYSSQVGVTVFFDGEIRKFPVHQNDILLVE
jgi:hypothetical protein